MSAGFGSAATGAGVTAAIGAAGTGADASTSFGAALAGSDFSEAGWRWASTALWMVRMKLPSGPATISCAAVGEIIAREINDHARSGRGCPSIPTRTSFTPSLPTLMRLCAVAITVLGKSTTMRAGESSVVTLGASAPFALNSTRKPSWL